MGPLTTAMAAAELVVLARALTCVDARARITGKYSGLAPAITALTATFSTVYSQASCGPHLSDNLIGILARAPQHCLDPRLGGQDDGQLVRPVLVEEALVEIVFGVRLAQKAGGSIECDDLGLVGIQRAREGLEHFRHERTAGDGIVAVDVGPQLRGCLAHHGLRDDDESLLRHAPCQCLRPGERLEDVSLDGGCRHSVFGFNSDALVGDRRCARTSVANADDSGVSLLLDFLVEGVVAFRVDIRFTAYFHLGAGAMLCESLPHLAHEDVAVIEAAVDQVDGAAFERIGTGGHAQLFDLWRMSHRIEDRESVVVHLFPPLCRARRTAHAILAPVWDGEHGVCHPLPNVLSCAMSLPLS